MNIREWLIRKLGGIPLPNGFEPREGRSYLIENNIVTIMANSWDEIRDMKGCVPMPKPGQGQIVVGPVVRKLPRRKVEAFAGLPDSEQGFAGKPVHDDYLVDPLPVFKEVLNLCGTCDASVQACNRAVKEKGESNNTLKCDQFKAEG
jgi:hypothetical protein